MKIRHIQCKSILSKSGLSDYALNCYRGCAHGCRYCYARFMTKFTEHAEPWGEFVDVKVNAAEALSREVEKKKKGEVFISSVCDGWQPLEAKYGLTRKCLELLLQKGFTVSILTKSALVERDFDVLGQYPGRARLGFTITSLDERLRVRFEPLASPYAERISVLKKAATLGIKTYVFLGPLLPYVSDGESAIDGLFSSLHHIELDCIYLDRLNSHYGVWGSLFSVLKTYYPDLIGKYRLLLFDKGASEGYSVLLADRARKVAKRHGREAVLRVCF